MDNRISLLIDAIQELSLAKDIHSVADTVRHMARKLANADGATFVLRDAGQCYYYEEDAISPLWKGMKFPMESCISGWAMLNKQNVFIPDIYLDDRIPHDAYRPTFVKSLLMVPIRKTDPIGAIGIYWKESRQIDKETIQILENLANSTSIALQNVQLLSSMTELNLNLKKAVLARDDFLSIASHELNTPLSSLKLQIQMSLKKMSTNEKDLTSPSETLSKCLVHVNHLANIVKGFVDFARLQSDSVQLNYSKFDISSLMGDVLDNYSRQFSSVGSNVICDLEPGLIGYWDKERIEQIFNNLLSNMIKYAPGEPVYFAAKTNGKEVQLLFRDSGPGIPNEYKERIFGQFERGESSHNIGGIGIGLYVVRKLIESHGGKLCLVASKGHGCDIEVRLPFNP